MNSNARCSELRCVYFVDCGDSFYSSPRALAGAVFIALLAGMTVPKKIIRAISPQAMSRQLIKRTGSK